MAKKCAEDGAKVVIAAKTVKPHPILPGTIFTAAKEVEEAGGEALPIELDIRNDDQIVSAVEKTVSELGGIDILINNAAAISITDTENTTMKKYDLMHDINGRGVFLMSKICMPHLLESANKGTGICRFKWSIKTFYALGLRVASLRHAYVEISYFK